MVGGMFFAGYIEHRVAMDGAHRPHRCAAGSTSPAACSPPRGERGIRPPRRGLRERGAFPGAARRGHRRDLYAGAAAALGSHLRAVSEPLYRLLHVVLRHRHGAVARHGGLHRAALRLARGLRGERDRPARCPALWSLCCTRCRSPRGGPRSRCARSFPSPPGGECCATARAPATRSATWRIASSSSARAAGWWRSSPSRRACMPAIRFRGRRRRSPRWSTCSRCRLPSSATRSRCASAAAAGSCSSWPLPARAACCSRRRRRWHWAAVLALLVVLLDARRWRSRAR